MCSLRGGWRKTGTDTIFARKLLELPPMVVAEMAVCPRFSPPATQTGARCSSGVGVGNGCQSRFSPPPGKLAQSAEAGRKCLSVPVFRHPPRRLARGAEPGCMRKCPFFRATHADRNHNTEAIDENTHIKSPETPKRGAP